MKHKKLLTAAAIALSLSVFVFLMMRSTGKITQTAMTDPAEHKTRVIIDPGHGGEDGGAVVGNILEKNINLDISRDTADLLRLMGFDVSMTRSNDNALTDEGEDVKKRKYNDMRLRLSMYNSSPDNVIISIHQNKFSNASSKGAQVFYSPNNDLSARLAESIRQSTVSQLQPDNSRECKAAGKEIYLLKNTDNPAVIVECGFLSNSQERQKLLDTEYQKQLALAVVTGFLDYYNNN